MTHASPGASEGTRRRVGILVVVAAVLTALVVGIVLVTRDPAASGPPASTTATAVSITPPGPTAASATSGTPPGASASPTTTATVAPSPTETTPVPTASLPSPTATGRPTVVPTRVVRTTKAPLRETGDLGSGVSARVTRIESVDGEARGPGEVAGPALRVTLEIKNSSKKDVAMSSALTNLYYGKKRLPASVLSGPGVEPFPASVAAGRTAAGRYVFGVPDRGRDPVVVEFSLTTDAPTVEFEGRL